jgi:anti-sigma factor ChrR (cupin superfamily)
MDNYVELREGIQRKPLARDEERNIQIDILKINAGFDDSPHWHDDWEWVYILEGSLEDEKGIHRKGDFLINEKDVRHQPKSKDGCTLLIVWSGSVRHKE